MQEIVVDTQNLLSDNDSRLPWIKNHFHLWSLEDMLKIAAKHYVILGEYLHEINLMLKELGNADEPLMGKRLNFLKNFLDLKVKKQCDTLCLPVSSSVLADYITRLSPLDGVNAHEERGRLATLMNVIIKELESQLFLYVLPHHATYYRWGDTFSEQLTAKFPQASRDLVHAGNCFAVEEYTACVYHSVRAIELAFRALASYLKVELRYPIEFAEWKDLFKELDKKIIAIENRPRSSEREEELSFCSTAITFLRNFKNAYRKPIAHSREPYEEAEAESIMQRTKEFIESLIPKLSEKDVL